MSLLPLQCASLAVSFFEQPVSVRDVSMSTVEGEDVEAPTETRTIKAAINTNGKKLVQVFGQSVSDGDIGIHTYDTLFIADAYDSVSEVKQSYVTYGNREYRVIEVGNWTDQAAARYYLATRHVRQDGL